MKFSLLLCLFVYCSALNAQNYIPVTGENASGTGGSMSYTIGQVVFLTKPGSGGSIAEGVQQPFEISTITSIEEDAISLELSVYPNPFADFVILKIDSFEFANLNYRLYGISGDLIQFRKIEQAQTQIQMENLKPGSYFIKVSRNDSELKTFKIIKK